MMSFIAFLVGAVVIVTAGSRLARVADELADRTGMGEALFGLFLLAGVTSLPDFAATLSAALDSRPDLAMSNIMGSMAANLAFLGIADAIYRKANLEHAAASSTNLLLAALLIVLLALPLLAIVSPPLDFLGAHPVTPLIVAAYISGLYLVRSSESRPMWFPRVTLHTVPDEPAPSVGGSLSKAWIQFSTLAVVTGVAGWVLMEGAKGISDQTGLSDTVVGGLLTALATSSPELVTTIAAIRRGALTLAVSNIFGTNCFNMIVVAAADLGYPGGSIYHDMAPVQMTWGLISILMTAILLMGMLQRQRYGIGRIGFESALILSVYIVALGIVTVTG
ncbi:sodium:calcium antiporter [Marinobacter halotolerans]|uniref:sodium:calcium antiporter n=1 Tax=Marinobacter halotolerans TaxID=1569211 RepID=UPI0012449660|nr:sodium:calcium antiporter [Marinobacter halotolerans]